MRRLNFFAGLSVAAFSALPLMPAFAHAALVQSSPASDATGATPKVIRLMFSEKIVPTFSGLKLSMADGMVVSTAASVSDDGKTLIARPTSPFMSGKWTVSWHATAAGDGHKSEGSYTFTIK